MGVELGLATIDNMAIASVFPWFGEGNGRDEECDIRAGEGDGFSDADNPSQAEGHKVGFHSALAAPGLRVGWGERFPHQNAAALNRCRLLGCT